MSLIKCMFATTGLLLLAAISSLAQSQLATKQEFIEINNYLESTLHDTNIDANLREAKNWLNKIKNDPSKKSLVEALETFTSLEIIQEDDEDEMCTPEAYKILRANDNATGGRYQKLKVKHESMRQIEHVVSALSYFHADKCQKHHLDQYLLTTGLINFKIVRQVRVLFEKFIDRVVRDAKPWSDDDNIRYVKLYDNLIRYSPPVQYSSFTRSVYGGLIKLAKERNESKYLFKADNNEINRQKFEELYKKYVINNCEYMVNELDMFYYATYDALILLEPLRLNTKKSSPKSSFYNNWALYRVCHILLLRHKQILLEDLLKLAAE